MSLPKSYNVQCLIISDRYWCYKYWYGKELISANKYYLSTQRCSKYDHIKTGEENVEPNGNLKYGTKHNEYICYECGNIMDWDEKAVLNLLALI